MNFQGLGKVETSQSYLDIAFKRAKLRSSEKASSHYKDRVMKAKTAEIEFVIVSKKVLCKHLDRIIKSFPSIDNLDDFYKNLVRATLDYARLKRALGAVNWGSKKIEDLFSFYLPKLKLAKSQESIVMLRKRYVARVSSVLKQIDQSLRDLEDARKILKSFPSIKTSLFTVALAGYPNVGKSTLLSKLTTAKPEIQNYAFTTKRINLGYSEVKKKRIQFIDTPGIFDRALHRMNPIEMQSYLVLKYLASCIFFLIDPQGYTIKEQVGLLQRIRKRFSCPIIVVINKSDMGVDETVVKMLEKHYTVVKISAETRTNIPSLLKELAALKAF